MQVVILAGGAGTRVLGITNDLIPKALMKVTNITILEHQVSKLPFGAHVLLLIGNEKFEKLFQNEVRQLERKYKVTFSVIQEGENLGTAGALFAVKKHLEKDFIVLMGDLLFSFNLEKVWATIVKRNCPIGLIVRKSDHPEDSDLVELNEYGLLTKIWKYPHEKLEFGNGFFGIVGIVYLQKKLLTGRLGQDQTGLVTFLSAKQMEGIKVSTFQFSGIVRDIGTVERFEHSDVILREVFCFDQKPTSNLVILDKDDTLIKDQNPRKLIRKADMNLKLLKKVKNLHASDQVLIVTNQPGVAKGFFTEKELDLHLKSLSSILEDEGIKVQKIIYCPHHPDSGYEGEIKELKVPCDCRKPNIAHVIEYLNDSEFQFEQVYVYGDSFRDRLLASNLGAVYKYSSTHVGIFALIHRLYEYFKYNRLIRQS